MLSALLGAKMGNSSLPESVCDKVESNWKPRRDSSFSEMKRAPVAPTGSQAQRVSKRMPARGIRKRWAWMRIFSPRGSAQAGIGRSGGLNPAAGPVHLVKNGCMHADGNGKPKTID